MFDWSDEELANIVWGEACETDDHIVPYPEASEDFNDQKEWNQEASATKLNEQKRIEAKNDFHQGKLGSSSKLDIIEGPSASQSGTNSWPDLSLSSAAKTDHGSLGAEVSKNLEETTQLEKDVEKQGDFVNYAWDNIGSFDDLDRIFSNDDSIFGHVTLDNSDVLWSSKDVSNSTVPTFLDVSNPTSGFKNRSEPLEIKAEHVQQNDQALSPRFMEISDSSSHDIQNAPANTFNVGYATDRITPAEKEQQTNQDMVGRTAVVTSTLASVNAASASGLTHKDFGQKNRLKARKKTQGKQEEKTLQELYGSWAPASSTSGQFQNQLVSSVIQSSPSSTLGQQNQLQGPETLYQDIKNTYATPPAYGNLPNTYASMSMLPHAHSGVVLRQPLLSGYESSLGVMNPVSKSMDIVKPPSMTPQEKIEKLRRRQQMQAMLAIQKQQQEFGHQVPIANKSTNTNCAVEMHSQLCDGTDPEIEDLRSLPALDPPSEQDDSNTISFAIDDNFVEDTILYMLQDVISKLDVKIRLCIRDSLFRLAQSALLRNYASDTSSTNNSSRDELKVIAREESINQNRYARIADVETKTNPIDRTVAHLLFHRPLDLTGNYPDKLESPTSAKIQFESKAANLEKFPMGYLRNEDLKSNQQFSHTGLEAQPEDQFKNSHCIDTSDNASNNELAHAGDQVLEASQ